MIYVALILSVLIGALLVIALKPTNKVIQLLLAFSGAYLLSITVMHLIPEAFESHQHNIGVFILGGILLQTILEYFSKGAEHGHFHVEHGLNKVPWLVLISLFVHAFVEGIPLHVQENNTLLWGIIIHKIPVALVLTAFLIKTKLPKATIFCILGAFAIMSPLGAFTPKNISFFEKYHTEIIAVIIGVFLHIASVILFESSQNHKFNIRKFIAVLLGFAIAYVSANLGHHH